MRFGIRLLSVAASIIFAGSGGYAATISGTVKGPDGAPFQGSFVEAQNTRTKMTVIVLSNTQGRYRIDKLPAGEYQVQIKVVGYRAQPQTGVNLSADQNASFNFALEKGMVRWSDISYYQAKQLWPPATGKDLLFKECSICHQFQTRMASVTRDADGWKDRLAYMREVEHYGLAYLTDQQADDIASYITRLFGPDSELPKSPEEMPGYQGTVRPFSSEAMNIVYMEYDMPGPSRMPFSAAPDKDGYLWIPNCGPANKITRLDPKTGEMKDFTVPYIGTAGVHSAIPAPDGSVWLSEQGSNRVGRWDPSTQKITEFQDRYLPGKEGTLQGGEKHTIRLDQSGSVWASGNPLTKFDPETGKFTRFEGINTYDVKPDKDGTLWFTSPSANKIGKVDEKTMKMTEWDSPTPGSAPRRMEIGLDGIIWSGEFVTGKMIRFDPATQTIKEYPLPGPDPSPYALGIDTDGYVWYNSHHMDVVGRFDPKTGKVIEYPFPHSELALREFFRDSAGRMWYGSTPNNKVGYFYLAGKSGGAETASN